VSDADLRTCEMLAEGAAALGRSGYSTAESRKLLEEIAVELGYRAEIALTPTTVVVEDRVSGTVAIRQINNNYRFDQIDEAQVTLTELRKQSIGVEEATLSFLASEGKAPPLPWWLRVFGYALSSVGFAAYLRMGATNVLAAGLLGFIVGAALVLAGPSRRMSSLMPLAATFFAALAVAVACHVMSLPDPVRLAAISVVILLPGGALTTAVVDLVGGDMVSGASRLIYAVFQLASMAFGFCVAISLVDLSPSGLTDYTSAAPVWVAWIGVMAFAIGIMLYFCMPKSLWIPSFVIILVTYGAQSLAQIELPSFVASGVAACVGLTAALFVNSRRGSGPLYMALFLPSFWLIVPGSLSFVAVAGVLTKDPSLSSLGGLALLTLLSMAIGIMIATLMYPAHSPKPAPTSPPTP